jgi:peptidoglycan/LPS O-acetylase OafA/YrhL
MTCETPAAKPGARFWWLDCIRGMAILWIVYFHFFCAYNNNTRYPWVLSRDFFPEFLANCAPASFLYGLDCIGQSLYVALVQLGFHCVGVFLVASGFGLTYSLAKTGNPVGGWTDWYKKRVLRLFPMYWVAHLIYLVSPFVTKAEPVDYRFFLSFIGERIWPLDTIFYYANPAWWYFALLLQLYVVFPFLFRFLQRLGATRFLMLCAAFTLVTRYLLLEVLHADGNYLQGAFFGSRLFEFAAGMALGLWSRQRPLQVEKSLFSRGGLVLGFATYALGILSYGSLATYTVSDAFTGVGLFIILAHGAMAGGKVAGVAPTLAYVGAYSYGLYLIHQPYVLYAGERMRGLNLPMFTLGAGAIVAVLVLGAIGLERFVNELTNLVLGRGKVQPASAGAPDGTGSRPS